MKRNDVLNELYDSRLWKDIKKDFVSGAKRVRTMQEQAEFLNKYSFYLLYESPMSTIKGRALEMRKELINSGIKEDSPILSFFKLHTNIYTSMNKKYSDKVADKLTNVKNDDVNYYKLATSIIAGLIDNIKDSDTMSVSNNSRKSRELAYQKLIVLALATGRRQIEIMKMLELRKKGNEVQYLNLAKKKDSDNDSIIAPILIDLKIAKKYLDDIKKEFGTAELTNKQVNSKFNGSVSKSLFRYLDEKIAKKGFHYFRSIYAEACYEKFGNNTDRNIYFQKVLGHELKLNAAHSYQAKTK